MRYLKFIIPVLFMGLAFGTAFKRPLSLQQQGKMPYLTWTGTAPVTSSDVITFYADTTTATLRGTAASYLSPLGYTMEKVCVSVKGTAQADSTTSTLSLQYAPNDTGTYAEAASTTIIHPGTTALYIPAAVSWMPENFWILKLTISSATDSLYPTNVKVWGCED